MRFHHVSPTHLRGTARGQLQKASKSIVQMGQGFEGRCGSVKKNHAGLRVLHRGLAVNIFQNEENRFFLDVGLFESIHFPGHDEFQVSLLLRSSVATVIPWSVARHRWLHLMEGGRALRSHGGTKL